MNVKRSFKFTSYMKEVEKDMRLANMARTKAAIIHVLKIMRKMVDNPSISSPGNPPGLVSGDLKKGIAWDVDVYKNDVMYGYVGFRHPAQHAHLLEFGTRERTSKNGKQFGAMAPRPFFKRTLEEASPKVKEIMSTPWGEYV